MFEFSSCKSKKCLSLESKAWNVIFQILSISSHLLFLLNSYKDLHGNMGTKSKFFISLLTISCKNYLFRLKHFQSLMELWWSLLKKSLSFWKIAEVWTWYEWIEESKILLAICIKSVIITMQFMLSNWIAWFMLHLIVKSSVSLEVILIVWWRVLMMDLSWTYI